MQRRRLPVVVHAVVGDEDYTPAMLGRIRAPLHDQFGVYHLTVQLGCEGFEEPRTET